MTAPSNPAVLGAWLKELRLASKLSRPQAGQTIGVSEREIRRWEDGAAPGGINLLRLLFAYGVRIAPSPPAAIPGAVNAELARLEKRLERQGKATTTALSALAAAVGRIEQRLDAQDPPANRRTNTP